MKFLKTLRGDQKRLPPIAGGAPEPGERLSEAMQYMEPREAQAAAQMIEAWRQLSPAEYEAFARSL
jgi:hypothetical protein